jgi:DNA-binding transcriptional LysR family regulator
MPRNVDTALLRAFVAVAETSGMTAAGSLLNLTQAAISQQIKRLEESFGCQLFDRARGLQLTAAGERLLGRAKRLLALNDEIWAEMTEPVQMGEIRIGIPYDIVATYLPPILKRLANDYPKVRPSLVCLPSLELIEALDAGRVDIALVEEQVGASADGETLASERLIWVGAKGGEAYAQRPLRISFGSPACVFRPAVIDALRRAEIEWATVSEVGNADVSNATVQMDLAVMAMLASSVPSFLKVLGPESGLPLLPQFAIKLHLPRAGSSVVAKDLAHQIREMFVGVRVRAA